VAEAGRRTRSRRDLARHSSFEQISPEVGAIDEAALDEAMAADPDETLGLLADLTGATDPQLRDLARRLAGRLMLEVGRRMSDPRRGIGRIVVKRYSPDGGDVDIDASLDELATVAVGTAPDPDRLRIRGWSAPTTALCLMVDRSGSMGGAPLATSAVAAAAVAMRTPADYSVIAFGREVVVAKSQDAHKPSDAVVNDVLTLRGHGTTDVAAALHAAALQLSRSRAGRKIAVLLSDCRQTEDGDVEAAAGALDELVIIAPDGDDDEARALAGRIGARSATVSGPSDVPRAIAAVLDRG